MSLIQCKECTREISDTAASCPHCGAPSVPKESSVAKGVKMGFGMFFVLPLVIIGGIIGVVAIMAILKGIFG